MAKVHRPLNPAQLERRESKKAGQQFWDRIWLALMIAALLAVVGFNIYTQIIHHP
ncbi:MAG: hypothetical protein HY343_04580 [Lentisphaerae bacterium]|nr:hypothetical protein [Lentisphaerota bacterium]